MHEQASIGPTSIDSINTNTGTCKTDIGFGPSRSRNDHSPFIETRSTRRPDRNRDEMTPFLLEGDMNISLSSPEGPKSNLHHMQMQRQMKVFEEMNAQLLIVLMKNTNKSRKALERSERNRKRSHERASRTTSHDCDLKCTTHQEDHGNVQDFESRPIKRKTLDLGGNASRDNCLCHPLKKDEKTHEREPSSFIQLGLDDLVQQDFEVGGHEYDVHASFCPFEDSSVDSECSNEQEAEASTYAAAVPTSIRRASISLSYEHEYAYHDEYENEQMIEPTSLLGSSSRKGFMQNVSTDIPTVEQHNSFDTTIIQDDYRNQPLLPMYSEPIPLSCDDKEVLLRVLNAV